MTKSHGKRFFFRREPDTEIMAQNLNHGIARKQEEKLISNLVK